MPYFLCLIFVVAFLSFYSFPDIAFASTHTKSPVGDVLCIVQSFFTGNAGKGIACIGILILGVGAMYGKITWAQATVVGVGIAILFGADSLIIAIGGYNCHSSFA